MSAPTVSSSASVSGGRVTSKDGILDIQYPMTNRTPGPSSSQDRRTAALNPPTPIIADRRSAMKDYINNSSDSSSPSNLSGTAQLPGEEEEKPGSAGQATNHTQAQAQATRPPTPPGRMALQDPIELAPHGNRHSIQGLPRPQTPQLQAEDVQSMAALSFSYARPQYMYDQSLVNYTASQTNVTLQQTHHAHHGTMPSTANGVNHHSLVDNAASSFMHSLAGQGVAPSVISANLPISPVGTITAQLNDLNPSHGWLYSHTVGGLSPPHSPGENTNSIAFSAGANGAYGGYAFAMPPPPLQSGNKAARLSIGSSNDEEDGEHEPRSGLLMLRTVPKLEPNVKSDNSDSDHGNNKTATDQGSPKPRVDTRTARIQSEQRRRNDLRMGFERLRSILPSTYQRCSKTVLLERACLHIQALEDQIKNLSERTELLQAQHNTLTATHQNLVNSLGGHRLPQLQPDSGRIAHSSGVEYTNGINGVVNHETLTALNGGHIGEGVRTVGNSHD